MTAGLTTLDYAVLGVFLAAMAIVGIRAGRRQTTTDEFFLASRSLTWGPLALSLAVAGGMAVYYCSTPNEAYWVGLKLLLVPALIWIAVPIVLWCIIPLYGTLELDSVFEYLELRYNLTVRTAAAMVYVAGQVLWLGGVLALPCVALHVGTGLNLSVLALSIAIGGVATWYTYLGGMKATVRTDLVQFVLMAGGLVVLVFAVVANLKQGEGATRIWEVAELLGRDNIIRPTHGWSPQWAEMAGRWSVFSGGWSIWAGLAYLTIMPMFFFVADQSTLQRLLAARDDRDMVLSYLVGCGLFSILLPVAMVVGLGMLAIYHDDAWAEIPPHWVVNAAKDPATGQSLIGPHTPIDADSIAELVEQGAILDPNTNRPITDPAELIHGHDRLDVDRLATRAVGSHGGERLLRRGGDELFATFVKRHLRFGLAGVVLAALAAAAMATIDSGLTALATIVVVDFHRRHGWAERWLASQCGKDPAELDQTDELKLGRPMVLLFGAAVILVSLVLAQTGGVLLFLLGVMNLVAGPLLGIFLLGLFTRRTTAPAALAAMVLGMLAACWATLGHRLADWPSLAAAWPFPGPLSPLWPLSAGLAATLAIGYLVSFIIGKRKSDDELSGLVFRLGRWGVLPEIEDGQEEEVYWIEVDEEEPPPQSSWR